VERRNQQNVALFDTDRVIDLLDKPEVLDYLATLLASFTRIHSATIPIMIRPGIWRRLRVNDLDVHSLIRYAEFLDEDQRWGVYQRIGDACLFLTGLFPEYIDARQRYPHSRQPRPRLSGTFLQSMEDYEAFGERFYQLAASHPEAQQRDLQRVLEVLAEEFILAERPLSFLARHYLSFRKHDLFEL
jgi:hypothetical protein